MTADYVQAVAIGHMAVIMAGGPKGFGKLAILHQLHDDMTLGGNGAAFGRRSSDSEQLVATLKALRAVELGGASATEAIAILSLLRRYRRGGLVGGNLG